MYFVPILRSLPIFRRDLARQWLWTANLSPGYFGQGIYWIYYRYSKGHEGNIMIFASGLVLG